MERDLLLKMLDYDLWANRRWLAHLQDEASIAVFRHILAAQTVWLRRCQGSSPTDMPQPEPTEAELERLHAEWRALLLERGCDEIVAYSRLDGEQLQDSLGTIARHMLNHGTYHRGELRGLYRSRGDTSFPETDYILYANPARR
jgi:uncharacterized damage-inducible protein DinB